MNKPGTLFVYRAAKNGNHVAARCICCDVVSPEAWEANIRWNGFVLDSASSIRFRVAVTDVSGGPFGPDAVYADEDFMKCVDPRDRVHVLVAQNATYLEIDDVDGEVNFPFFVSLDEPTRPCSFQTTMDIAIDGLESLPEIIEYDTWSKASIADEWDAMAYSSLSKKIPYPIGCRFPAMMVSSGRECNVVYMFLETPRSGVVRVQIESSDVSVSRDNNTTILRRFRGSTGKMHEVEIGKLIGSSVVSC